mmetsp:Transcript_50980/g.121992  ORF Transcript_50980/g.121992 Transcript_50980/m.121992 type:complete len:89 (+) Transcript_50980:62-328(+)
MGCGASAVVPEGVRRSASPDIAGIKALQAVGPLGSFDSPDTTASQSPQSDEMTSTSRRGAWKKKQRACVIDWDAAILARELKAAAARA